MTYVLIGLIIAGMVVFYHTWLPFGARLRGKRKAQAAASSYTSGGRFQNLIPTSMAIGFRGSLSLLAEQLRGSKQRRPAHPLVPDTLDASTFTGPGTKMAWLGHSTVLLRIGNKNILFDPVFSERVSPFQWIGPKRYPGSLQASVADLPPIDAVVISHDHYDHLDYQTIRQLRARVRRFFVPLGVGAHLERWGIAPDVITELDWWQSSSFAGLSFTCTPARHFSGRRLGDRDRTLWGGWVVAATKDRVFFSGDSAYGPHFADIGKRYGPFTLSLLECGQYNSHWPNVHMLPEQTIQAAQDLRAKLSVPIHWGAFTLALHPWSEPPQRAGTAATQLSIPFATPRLGQIMLVAPPAKTSAWWPPYTEAANP